MVLTSQRSPRDPDAFPTFQLFLLAIVRLAEPIALTSIFPYAWSLVRHFEVGDEQDASFYAGLLISAFSLTEALMGMYWGGLSDRVGRKPVIIMGGLGTMISMMIVGLAPNIWVALFGRAFGGLLNGNIGVIQTMVGELVVKPEHEPRAFAVMPFVWAIGTIIGPAIGGIFANPHNTWPSTFPEHSWFAIYPYLLPNIMCSALLLVSVLLGWFLLEETHPSRQRPVMPPRDTYSTERSPLLGIASGPVRPPGDLGFAGSEAGRENGRERRKPSKICDRRLLHLIVSLSIFTYHSMTYDHLMPIFFEDRRAHLRPMSASDFNPFYTPGGLGLSVHSVGMILAVNGFIALLVQVVIFPMAAEKVGVFRLFLIVTALHPIAYLIVPGLIYVPESMLVPAIYICLAVRNLLSIVLFPLLLMLIKEATPDHGMLGKVNGLAASAGAMCRMIAPPVAGYLYSLGSQMDCTAIAWYISALVAIVGSVQCFVVRRDRRQGGAGDRSAATFCWEH